MTEEDAKKPTEDEEATEAKAEAEAEGGLTDEELEASAGGTRLRLNKTASPMVSPSTVMMEAAEIDELTGSQLVNKSLKK